MVVIARAAVGKTRCLTERVRFWLRRGVDPSDICAITFTNLAANEMQMRLEDDYKDGMFIGTIHSLAAHFLKDHGLGAKVGKVINDREFDEFFGHIKDYPACVEHYAYVLVDEAQDLSINEYDFIFNMIQPSHFFVVGDPLQCIYESLKGASPKYMESLMGRPDVAVYDLNENYRNKANILNYAKNVVRKLGARDNTKPMSIGGVIYEEPFNAKKFLNIIESHKPYKDWVVLCYTNFEVDRIMRLLREKSIPVLNFNQRDKSKKEMDDLMNQDKVKVLTVWCAKGLGFPNVVVFGRNWLLNKKPTKREGLRVDYVAYTRAMNMLIVYV
jgi:superfamily I DNA/RNA helicase